MLYSEICSYVLYLNGLAEIYKLDSVKIKEIIGMVCYQDILGNLKQ